MKTSACIFLLGLFLVGCAKEKEYKEVFKESTWKKEMLSSDPSDPYIYVPSVENTPMNVTASRPFWSGEQKLVIFKFTEKQLEVLELPSDPKFSKNENNFSPVFKLEIEHKEFKCKEDDFGECSNQEEEDKESTWSSKKFFKADFAKLAVLETNSLPEQLTNLFSKCFTDVGATVKDFKLEKDSFNIIVERTMTASLECADVESFDDLRNLTFKINHHYSFVKLSKIALKKYKPVMYPNTDQNSFGFFTTTVKKLMADNQTTLDSDMTLMNRWNPERGEITYHLSDAFYDEDMKSIKVATEKAVATINNSFERANVNLKINLADGRGKAVGDIRNSFLVLVKDPQASGVIGYGPSVTNPLTGEILKAQTVMYYGTIRKYIQETYDELVVEANEKKAKLSSSSVESANQTVENGAIIQGAEKELLAQQSASKMMMNQLFNSFKMQDSLTLSSSAPIRVNSDITLSGGILEKRISQEIFSHERMYKHHDLTDMVEEMSRQNMYHESMVNWNDALASAIEAGELNLKGAKPWNELNEAKKTEMIEKLMPFVWIPTLVHEMGHNLGLRHNFNGSEDKANYYTEAERTKLGVKRAVTYSSVMDYSYSSLNQLPVMGKYDIAALRFGYNREVEKFDGSIVKMSKATLHEMEQDGSIEKLKDFKYCTDEHVAVNPGCNRFDEGATLSEIAAHLVKDYKKKYEKRNKRNNRLNFSSVNDANYFMSSRDTFQSLRVFFEVFDRIKGMYHNLKPEQWESIEFLKEIKAATKIVADFYIEVLKTPSVHCAVINKATGKLAGIVPLEDITFEAISCFDDKNIMLDSSKFAVIAQTGKHFNHARSPDLRGDIKADPSQLSIRGIWSDKLMAMEFLMKREMKISTFDDYRTSFIDHPEFKDQVLEATLGMLSGKLSHKAVEFVTADGQKIPLEFDFEIGETHNIKKSFSSGLNAHLGIKKASTDMRELAIPMLKRNLLTADDETQTQGLLQSLSAYRIEPGAMIDPSMVAGLVQLKDENGKVVSMFAALTGNSIAINLFKDHGLRLKIEKHSRQNIIQVYQAKASGEIPQEIPEELKELFEIETGKLEAFLTGQMPSDKDLHKMLSLMSL